MSKDKDRNPDILEVADLAREYGLARSTIYAQVRRGALPAVKFGSAIRFRRETIEAYVRDQEARAAGGGQ